MLSLLLAIATITATPSAKITPTKTPDDIQKIRELVQQKVQEKLKSITTSENTSTTKGIIGKIIQSDTNQFTIEYQSNSRKIKYNQDTVFIDNNRNKSKSDKFKIGQDILAMGTFDSNTNTLEAKRVVGIDLTTITSQPRVIVIGKIVDISKSSPVFSLIPIKNKNLQYQIKTDTKTEIINSDDKKLSSSDLKSGQKIITILIPDSKNAKTYYAKKIINLDYQPSPTPTKKP